jgi:hypothetical protein
MGLTSLYIGTRYRKTRNAHDNAWYDLISFYMSHETLMRFYIVIQKLWSDLLQRIF